MIMSTRTQRVQKIMRKEELMRHPPKKIKYILPRFFSNFRQQNGNLRWVNGNLPREMIFFIISFYRKTSLSSKWNW